MTSAKYKLSDIQTLLSLLVATVTFIAACTFFYYRSNTNEKRIDILETDTKRIAIMCSETKDNFIKDNNKQHEIILDRIVNSEKNQIEVITSLRNLSANVSIMGDSIKELTRAVYLQSKNNNNSVNIADIK